jgi:hypothetical protein
MSDVGTIKDKYRALAGRLDEATLRLWAAVEARTLGRGGVSTVAKAIGMSRTTIHAGLTELGSSPPVAPPAAAGAPSQRRIRAEGGGRKKLTDKDPTLLRDLDALVEPTARGDPQSPLRWTCKSTARLAKELARIIHERSGSCNFPAAAQLFVLRATSGPVSVARGAGRFGVAGQGWRARAHCPAVQVTNRASRDETTGRISSTGNTKARAI